MKFINLVIENFGAIGSANIALGDQGLVLIQGENKDDSSAMSNGAGKSTVPDALCWALYGVTARGDSGDKVINRTAKRDCSVVVNITDGHHSWLVARYRKHSSEKNRVVVKQVDVTTGVIIDLTQGTDKATQEVIDKILGCTAEVFMASIYAGQEAMPNLPAMTDKQLKELIEQAAGIDRLQRAYEQARIEFQDANKAAGDKKSGLTFLQMSLQRAKDDLTDLSAAYEKYEDEAASKIDRMLTVIKELAEHEEEAEKAFDAFDPNLNSMYQATIDALKSVEGERVTLASREETCAQHGRDLARAEAVLEMAVKAAKKKRAEFDDVDTLMGKPCDACGKPHTPEERDELRKHIGEQLKIAIEEVKRLKMHVEAAKACRDEAAKAVEEFKATMKDTSALSGVLENLKNDISARKEASQKLANIRESILDYRSSIDEVKEVENPYKKSVAKCRAEVESNEKKIAECEEAIKAAEQEVELAQMAVEVFGPAGVRAHILDTVTPFLNAKTAEYLTALSDGNLTATWTTLGKTAKGEIREKFNIEVSSVTAGDSFGSLSGGEKRKVRLACAMALQDLVASRATKPIDLFIGDEIDHALDPAGLERLMGVLEQKAKERGTVLVISHGDLTDWIRQVMVVTKSGGYSTVSGALVI